MKFFVAFLALVAVAAADVSHVVASGEANSQILRSNNDISPEGFVFDFETSNGIQTQEQGQLKTVSSEGAAVVVQGENSYTAPTGERIRVTYEADENGYRPVGEHLPTPPPPQPIPEYILRALAYIEAHPPRPESL